MNWKILLVVMVISTQAAAQESVTFVDSEGKPINGVLRYCEAGQEDICKEIFPPISVVNGNADLRSPSEDYDIEMRDENNRVIWRVYNLTPP